MKWYLHPEGSEFSEWKPRAFGKKLPHISFAADEPNEALIGDTWSLLPLHDTPPKLDEGEMVKSRIVEVDYDKAIAVASYEVVDRPREEVVAQRLTQARDECRKRIVTVVNETAQNAMTATAAAGLFDAKQMGAYRAGLAWIAQMRGTWRDLANDRRKTITADNNWPEPPKALLALIQNF